MLTELVCQMLIPGNGLPCKHYVRSNEPGEPGFFPQEVNLHRHGLLRISMYATCLI